MVKNIPIRKILLGGVETSIDRNLFIKPRCEWKRYVPWLKFFIGLNSKRLIPLKWYPTFSDRSRTHLNFCCPTVIKTTSTFALYAQKDEGLVSIQRPTLMEFQQVLCAHRTIGTHTQYGYDTILGRQWNFRSYLDDNTKRSRQNL